MSSFTSLLEQHGALAMEKQLALGDLVGHLSWNVDIERGTITFGDLYEFPIQVLGTEAERPGTWLWSWANGASDIPPALLYCAEHLREFGSREGIPVLYSPEWSLEQVNGHLLSMVASGICQASAYYKAPYDRGAMFMLMNAPVVALADPPDLARMINLFMQFISMVEVADHKHAFESYATARGLSVEHKPDTILAHFNEKQALKATFDQQGRLAELTTTLSPA